MVYTLKMVILKMIRNMVMERRNSQVVIFRKAIKFMDKEKGVENTNGIMGQNTAESGRKTQWTV